MPRVECGGQTRARQGKLSPAVLRVQALQDPHGRPRHPFCTVCAPLATGLPPLAHAILFCLAHGAMVDYCCAYSLPLFPDRRIPSGTAILSAF
jgi:hypothetical protein